MPATAPALLSQFRRPKSAQHSGFLAKQQNVILNYSLELFWGSSKVTQLAAEI